jgi:two-component system sensor histidine kinase KdpD
LTVTTATTRRGRLKVYLGYAAGVGKTYQMLIEAQELAQAGVDVVIGYFEPHARADTIALTEGLETIPRREVTYRGTTFHEMDTDAVLARHPAAAVVDEFPHTNVPGSPRAKRWEDVHALLDAGIDVLTTMNVQHVESLNDQIWQSTGVRVRETIPDWVVQQADEVVMVDLAPRALLNRLERGVVYPPERAQKALANFFKEPTLVALRELALRQTAQTIERRAGADAAVQSAMPAGDVNAAGRPMDRLLLLIDANPASAALIRRGRRVADYLGAECLAAYVSTSASLDDLPGAERQQLDRQLNFARGLRIETRLLVGSDVPVTLAAFARLHGITQIFVSRPARTWRSRLGRDLVQRIVSAAPDMQVTIVANRTVRASRRT